MRGQSGKNDCRADEEASGNHFTGRRRFKIKLLLSLPGVTFDTEFSAKMHHTGNTFDAYEMKRDNHMLHEVTRQLPNRTVG